MENFNGKTQDLSPGTAASERVTAGTAALIATGGMSRPNRPQADLLISIATLFYNFLPQLL